MNFLAHYYLIPEKENADFVAGNLLPDLMRGFTKIYHQEIKPNTLQHDSDIIRGIHYHLATDKLFHNHDFFDKHCLSLKEITKFHGLPLEKNYIVSHVLLELLIDQYLMKKNEKLKDNFYASLTNVLDGELEERIKMTVSRQYSSKIISIFKGFKENRYADTLMEQNGIQQALYQIIGRRIGLSFEDKNWEKVIGDGKEKIKEDLPSFLKHLKDELNDA